MAPENTKLAFSNQEVGINVEAVNKTAMISDTTNNTICVTRLPHLLLILDNPFFMIPVTNEATSDPPVINTVND